MPPETTTAPPRRRLWRWITATLIALPIVALVGVHTPPVRRMVLHRVQRLAAGHGLSLAASSLSYNLLTLSATLRNIEVAARATPGEPFAAATAVSVRFGPRTLTGTLDIRQVTLDSPHVTVRRHADGASNLPSFGGGDGSPADVALPGIAATGLDVVVVVPAATVAMRNARLDAVPAGDNAVGLSLDAAGGLSVRTSDRTIDVAHASARASLASGLLTIGDVTLERSGTSVRGAGTIDLGSAGYPIDLRVTGAAELAGWLDAGSPARGTVGLDARATGSVEAPVVRIVVDGRSVSWGDVPMGRLEATAAWNDGVLTLSDAVAYVAGGRVIASGTVATDGLRTGRMDARWADVDAARVAPRTPAAGLLARDGNVRVTWRPTPGSATPTIEVSAVSGLTAGGTTTGFHVAARGRGDRWHVALAPTDPRLLNLSASADVRLNVDRPGASTLDGRIALRTSNLPSLVTRLGDFGVETSALDAATIGGAVEATVDLGGTLGAPKAAGRISGRALTSNGLPAADVDTDFEVDFSRRRTRGTFRASILDLTLAGVPAARNVEAGGTLEAEGAWEGALADPVLQVSFAGSNLDIAWRGAWPVAGTNGSVRVGLRGALSKPEGSGHVSFAALDVAGRDLGPLAADLVVSGGGLTITARAPQVNTTIETVVGLAAPHAFDGHAELADAALGDLVARAGLRVGDLPGTLSASARFAGTLAAPWDSAVTLDVRPTETVVRGVRVALDGGLGASLEQRRFAIRPATLVAGGLTLGVRAGWPLDGAPGELALRLDGDIGSVSPWLAADGAAPPWDAAGRVSVRLDVGGRPDDLTLAGTIAATLDRVTHGDDVVASAVVLTAAIEDQQLALREAAARVYGGRVDGHGAVPLAWANAWLPAGWRVGSDAAAPASLDATASFDLPGVMTALGRTAGEGLSGTAVLAASLSASRPELQALAGTLRLEQFRVQTGDYAYAQHSPTSVELRDGAARIAALDWRGPGSTLTGAGQIGLGASAATKVRLVLDSQLGVLGALFAGRATGRVNGFVELAGPPGGPVELRIDTTLSDASWLLPAQRVLFSGWSGHLRLADSAIVLDDLGGRVNGGSVRIDGRLALGQPDDPGSVTLEARDVLLDVPKGLHSQASADLSWHLVNEHPTIQGGVTITTNRYTEPVTRILELVDSFAHRTGGGTTLPESFATTNLAVDLHVTDPVVVDNSLGSVELVPQLRLIGTLDDPVVSGHVEVLNDGRIRLGGRTWRLGDSRITFAPNGDDLPALDVIGETEISDYDVTIRITGTPQAIQTTYSSTPPLGERELQSLVVTGRTDVTETAGDGDQYALDAATSDILGFAGKFVGLDSVRLGNADFDLMSNNVSTAQHLTVSKTFSRRFEVILSDNLEEGTFSWILVYRPTTQTEVRLASIDEETSTIEFRQTLYFGPGITRTVGATRSRGSGSVVRAVTITGDPGFSEDELRHRLRLEPGGRFDARVWIEDRLRLQTFYRDRGYHRVRIVPTRTDAGSDAQGAGVALSYAIDRGPLTVIDATGDGLPASAVNEMYEAWRALPIADVARSEFERIARESLATNGYFQPEIEVSFGAETAERAQATVHVSRGPETNSREIAWSGNQAISGAELNTQLHADSSDAPFWSEPESIVWSLRQLYASRGYLETTVVVGAPAFGDGTMRLPVSIGEGPQARVASVTLEGADPARREAALRALALSPGTTFTNTLPGEATRRLEAFYRSLGYRDVQVSHTVTPGEQGAIAVDWTVKEGPLSIVDAVRTTGVQSTSQRLVRQAVTLRPGAPLGSDTIDTTRRNLYNIGSFRRIDFNFGQKPVIAGDRRPVDVTIAAEEPRRFQFEYGLQLNSDRSFFGSGNVSFGVGAEVRDRNLFGHALQGSVGAHWDPSLQSLGLLVAAPRLFGRPVRTNLYIRGQRELDTLDGVDVEDDERDLDLDQRWRPLPTVELVWGYSLSRRRVVLENDTERLDIRGLLAGPNVSLVFDRRDSPFDATRGFFHSSNVQIGVEALGSELGYVRYLGRQSVYTHVGPVVLAGNGRWGTIQSYSGTVPLTALSLLFQTGGTNSVRGYEEESLSAVTLLGVPLGGSDLLVLNGEVRLPISKWVGAAAFVDAGNTFRSTSRIAWDNLGVGAGVGMRINTPLAPLRFDFAWPLSDQFGQHGLRVHFSVGQMF